MIDMKSLFVFLNMFIFVYLLMIASTGLTIYSLMDNAVITIIVPYVITIFALFCLTKIIDFLFDLDKQVKILVSDKISTEEE